MTLASRMDNLGTETAFEVLAKARVLEAQGKEIVHLEIGEPDFDTPKHSLKPACRPYGTARPIMAQQPVCPSLEKPLPGTAGRFGVSTPTLPMWW